ncbi:MAG: GHMP kinase [Gammaproteobacteria bacterium]|nr:GHMP kinase [Gammaproteobacteria bacterium]
MSAEGPKRVSVRTPARLHLGFLDLNGNLGRRFGSIGLALADIATEVAGTRDSDDVSATGPDRERAREYARRLMDGAGIKGGVRLEVACAAPSHTGLGSGTQLALAVGVVIRRLFDLRCSVEEIAAMLGRGKRSGIGIGTFLHGGFVVDGGRGRPDGVPPIVARLPVPESWRFLLVVDRAESGMSGDPEDEAIAHLPDMEEGSAAESCRLVLMQVLPALAEADCPAFGSAITRIQELMGRHFAHLQRGQFADPKVQEFLRFFSGCGATGIGQSSWGPTGFAVYASEMEAFDALRRARAKWHDTGSLDFVLCRAQNLPAEIRVDDALAQRIRRR